MSEVNDPSTEPGGTLLMESSQCDIFTCTYRILIWPEAEPGRSLIAARLERMSGIRPDHGTRCVATSVDHFSIQDLAVEY